MSNSDKNFMPAPAQFDTSSATPAAPTWLTQPTLETALIERIRGGGTLEEIKAYYAFMREIEHDKAAQIATLDFVAMQAKLPAVPKLGEIDIGKGKLQRYMRWEDINKLIKPVLTDHGFALNFHFVDETETHITMTAILKHRSGHIEQTTRKLPLDKSGSKNIVQAYGSSQSYCQRYIAIALLNLVAEGEDTDAITPDDVLTEAELEVVKQMLDGAGCEAADIARFCKAMKVTGLELLKRSQLEDAKQRIIDYKERKHAAANA